MKVLLAEDSRSNQMLIQAYVEDVGHQVIAVDNGQQAVDAFIKEQPDLVILDVAMPVKDGIQAAIEIRRHTQNDDSWVPIIFLSGMSGADDIVRGINAGGDDYLIKPVDAVVLNAKLLAMQRIANMRKQLHKANRKLKMMSVRDGLTGLANRRHFDEVIQKEMSRAMRTETSISLLLADIDYFKPFNDNYGHQAGDDCLKAVGQAMMDTIKRPGDLTARYGGEEFAFILPETSLENASELAESLRIAIEELSITHHYSTVSKKVTLSCGIASVSPKKGQDNEALIHGLIETADKNLYHAKEKGRNCISVTQIEPKQQIHLV